MSGVAAQRRPRLGAARRAATPRPATRSPRTSATTTWSASTRRSATWCRVTSPPAPPRTSATRAAASAPASTASTSTSPTPSPASAATPWRRSTATSSRCTSASPARTRTTQPMRIYPAVHYTMGGLWVDYDLQSTIPGLFVIGEANFSDHGANRLGASALMQGLADGYFVLPTTIGDYLADAHKFDAHRRPGRRRRRDRGQEPHREAAVGERHPHRRLLPPRARQAHVGLLRHGAHRRGPAQGAGADPRTARRVLARRQGQRRQRGAQPGARTRRPGGRLLRPGRARCAWTPCTAPSRAAATSAPSRRTPTARPCATTSTSPTSRPGSRPPTARSCTRKTSSTST